MVRAVRTTAPAAAKADVKPPASYEPEARYRIKVNRAVEIGPGHYARPNHANIVVTGAFAETIKDAIVSAEKV